MHRFLKSSALARRCPQRSPSSWQAERPSHQNTLASLCIGRFQHHFWTWWFLLSSPVPNNFLSIEMESFIHTSLHQRPAMKLNEIDRERIRNTKKSWKKRSLGKGGKWKKGRLKPVEAILICHDQKNGSGVFQSFVFFSICSLFPFFCCNPIFSYFGVNKPTSELPELFNPSPLWLDIMRMCCRMHCPRPLQPTESDLSSHCHLINGISDSMTTTKP